MMSGARTARDCKKVSDRLRVMSLPILYRRIVALCVPEN